MELDYNLKEDRKCINYICAYIVFQALNMVVKLVIGGFSLWSVISKGILAVFMLLALTVILRKKFVKFLIIEVLVAVSFLYTHFINIGEADINTIAFNAIVVFIPLFFSTLCIENYETFINSLQKISVPTIIMLIVVYVASTFSIYEYNMALGYAMLFQLLLCIDRYLIKKKWYDLLLGVILLSCILLGGSRGPLLCIFVYAIMLLSFSNSINKNEKKLFVIIFIFAAVIILISWDAILLNLIQYLETKGMSSRTLYLLYNKNFTSTGRDTIYRESLELIKNGPIFGYGTAGAWSNGFYPHNIFIEFLLSYGFVFGSFFSLMMLACWKKGLFLKDPYKRRLSLVLVAYTASLMISNSFILEPLFFVAIPVFLSEFRIVFGRRR